MKEKMEIIQRNITIALKDFTKSDEDNLDQFIQDHIAHNIKFNVTKKDSGNIYEEIINNPTYGYKFLNNVYNEGDEEGLANLLVNNTDQWLEEVLDFKKEQGLIVQELAQIYMLLDERLVGEEEDFCSIEDKAFEAWDTIVDVYIKCFRFQIISELHDKIGLQYQLIFGNLDALDDGCEQDDDNYLIDWLIENWRDYYVDKENLLK